MPRQQCKCTNTDRPNVDFVAVPFTRSYKQFRAEIVRCPTDGILTFIVVVELCGKPEIRNLHTTITPHQKVLKFQVSVNDVTVMKVTDTGDHISQD
jgi:hypothetical protein